jgi:hypothetical protein
MMVSGCSKTVADPSSAAEPQSDSVPDFAGQRVFAFDPGKSSVLWALELPCFEQVQNRRSLRVPFPACTDSSSFDFSL